MGRERESLMRISMTNFSTTRHYITAYYINMTILLFSTIHSIGIRFPPNYLKVLSTKYGVYTVHRIVHIDCIHYIVNTVLYSLCSVHLKRFIITPRTLNYFLKSKIN